MLMLILIADFANIYFQSGACCAPIHYAILKENQEIFKVLSSIAIHLYIQKFRDIAKIANAKILKIFTLQLYRPSLPLTSLLAFFNNLNLNRKYHQTLNSKSNDTKIIESFYGYCPKKI